MDDGALVLVIEDDSTVSDVVCRYLKRDGYAVDQATDGMTGLRACRELRPDLVVLDLMLPVLPGVEVCRALRMECDTPIIMLTALADESERISGLSMGADDYITKPFSPRELALRVRSVLRRGNAAPHLPRQQGPLYDGDLKLDTTARAATRGGQSLPLTTREFDLLEFLLRHPDQAFNRADLLSKVWGWDVGDQSTVTVHVRRLREKIEPDPTRPSRIVTVWGVGYRYQPADAV